MALNDLKLTATTNASGAATTDATQSLFGWLYAVLWDVGTFAAGVDATFSTRLHPAADADVLTLTDANSDALYYPREAMHNNAGAALTATLGGDNTLPFVAGQPRMVIAQGGDTLAGGATLFYLDKKPMKLEEVTLTATTDGAGAATKDGPPVNGLLYAVNWNIGTAAAGVDVVLSTINHDAANTNLLTLTDANSSATYYPRAVVHDNAGTALTGTAGGDRAMPLFVGNPRIVIAQGGATKTCTVSLYYYE